MTRPPFAPSAAPYGVPPGHPTPPYAAPVDPSERVRVIEIVLFGAPGQPGWMQHVDGRFTRKQDKIAGLGRRLEAIEKMIAIIGALLITLRWLALTAIGLAVVLAPKDLSDAIVRGIGAIKTLGGL